MNKVKEQKGFTLIEMLIVVAIIAILVAVSIPLVGSALEHARETTDAANERAFKALLVTTYLQNQAGITTDPIVELGKPYCYDAVNGKLVTNADRIEPYGKERGDAGAHQNYLPGSTNEADHQGCYLWGHIGNTDNLGNVDYSTVYMGWSEKKQMEDTSWIGPGTLTSPWLQ